MTKKNSKARKLFNALLFSQLFVLTLLRLFFPGQKESMAIDSFSLGALGLMILGFFIARQIRKGNRRDELENDLDGVKKNYFLRLGVMELVFLFLVILFSLSKNEHVFHLSIFHLVLFAFLSPIPSEDKSIA